MFSDGSVGRSAFVAARARLTETTIGARVSVYRNAMVRNSIIGDDCWVGDDAVLADVELCGNNSVNRRNVVLRSRIGRYSYTGNNTTIRSSDVGRFCSISWNVSVGGGDHEMAALTTMTKERFSFLDNIVEAAELRAESLQRLARLSSCIVGNDVWIGTGVIVMNGVSIGDGAVIGAGAVVTHDVPPFTIVVGAPARVLRKRFSDEIIDSLAELEWWNWPSNVIREHKDLIFEESLDQRAIERLRAIARNL